MKKHLNGPIYLQDTRLHQQSDKARSFCPGPQLWTFWQWAAAGQVIKPQPLLSDFVVTLLLWDGILAIILTYGTLVSVDLDPERICDRAF